MSIELPTDEHGLTARECPAAECSPAYFKVRFGTGITEEQKEAFCPYCGRVDDPDAFLSRAQIEYAKNVAVREAHKGINQMLEKTFGRGHTRRRKSGGDFISMEMHYKPGRIPHVSRPLEEQLQRDLVCPHCGLVHAVFGLATWCPDCGADIFLTHVAQEFAAVNDMLGDVDRRRTELGARVAARDLENALEDIVSIFEAVLRSMTRRHLLSKGMSAADVETTVRKKVGNRYQNLEQASDVCRSVLATELFHGIDDTAVTNLRLTFEKRHPIAHNLGIVDRKYLEKVRSGDVQGRDVPVTASEVRSAIAVSQRVLAGLFARLFAQK